MKIIDKFPNENIKSCEYVFNGFTHRIGDDNPSIIVKMEVLNQKLIINMANYTV